MKKIILFLSFFILCVYINLNAQYGFNVIGTFGESRHEVVSSSFSKDGTLLVTTGSDSSIIIWNEKKKTILRTISGLKARQNAAKLTADNRYLISGGKDNIATLWDLSAIPPKSIKTFEGHKGQVKTLDISPDGKLLATGSSDRTVRLWDVQTSDLVFELRGQGDEINSVKFSPDGTILASAGADGIISLWNASSGSKITSVRAHRDYIREIKFSFDGKLLASCGDDRMIYTWQVPAMTKAATFTGHKDRVQSIDFTPDGRNVISGGWDRLIILWDVETQKMLARSERQKQIVVSVNISPLEPDFISSCYESEDLDTWVITGLDEKQFGNSPGLEASIKENKNDSQETTAVEKNPTKITNHGSRKHMIEFFSPLPVNGKIISDRNNVVLIGRVYDSAGVSAFMINKNPVRLSDAGVFQYSMNLGKGDNSLDLVALNSKMWMDEQQIVITCTASDAFPESSVVTDISKGKFYALIIGIDNYQDKAIDDLDKPVRDAENLYNVLITRYTFDKDNMILLKDPELDQITTTLEGLTRKLTGNDNLLIFYAGHGYWDSGSNTGYWLPSDATKGSTIRWFRNSTLRDFIAGMQAKHVLLIADACFSGAILKTRSAFNDSPSMGIEKLYARQSRKAMTSGITEVVPDESMFFKFLLKRLDENTEKYLTAEQLFNSFRMAVMDNSPVSPQFGTIQNVGDDSGDFVFVKKD